MRALALFVAFVAFVALVSASGCKQSEPAPPVTCALYWSVEKDGKTTHLLGTVHDAVEATQLPKQVWDDLEGARALAVEADVLDPALPAKMKRGDGLSLRDELGPAYWEKLQKVFGPQGANQLAGFKTYIVTVAMLGKYMPRNLSEPMDLAFMKAARKQKKQIVFLESGDSQLQLMEKHISARELKHALDDTKRVAEDMRALVTIYMNGDEPAMVKMIADQRTASLALGYTAAELDELHADMFDRRNQAWIAPIESLHASGGGFVAVGAAHLVGPGSVKELLASKGYTVKRAECATANARTNP